MRKVNKVLNSFNKTIVKLDKIANKNEKRTGIFDQIIDSIKDYQAKLRDEALVARDTSARMNFLVNGETV